MNNNEELNQKLDGLETRLKHIESFLIKAFPEGSERNENRRTHESPTTGSTWTKPSGPTASQVLGRPPVSTESKDSANWLAVVAVICFVFAAGFIIKLAIDSDWLTPVRQLGLAGVFGIALIFTGIHLLSSDREYAAYLPAAGVIVLYLTAFAGYRWHALMSYHLALAMITIVSCICLWLYFEIRSDLYPIMAALGTYVSPLLLFSTAGDFILYYYVVASLAFASISIWTNTRTLTVVASYAAIVCTSLSGLRSLEPTTIWILLLVHALIFSLGSYLHTKQSKQAMSEQQAMAFFPVLLIFYASQYFFLEKSIPSMAPVFSLGFATFLIALYLGARTALGGGQLASATLVYGFAAVVVFHSFYLTLLPEALRPWLMIAMIASIALLPEKLSVKPSKEYSLPAFAAGAILVVEFLRLVWNLVTFQTPGIEWIGLCTVWTLWAVMIISRKKISDSVYQQTLGVTHFLAVLVGYRLVDKMGSLAVSASWLFYAVAVLAFAYTRKDTVMARSALIVLALAAVKALLFDAASAPNVVRIFCLLITGAVLYGSGFLLRRIKAW